ncbi:MAG: 23S rRNA (uracil(1939)-C(5))-methyltransferase RlmD [Gammaproteobacteria bacterium]
MHSLAGQIKKNPVYYAQVQSLTHECRGVARNKGKAVFVDGALPGEEVLFYQNRNRKKYSEGTAAFILKSSPDRANPKCAHYGICGGCSFQHMDGTAQIAAKEQIMMDNFRHIGKLEPIEILPPVTGDQWGYRRKARLGVKYVRKKETVLVGFREKRSSFLAEINACEVLHPSVGQKITALRRLIAKLKVYNRIPQIEVAMGDDSVALVIRHLDDLVAEDIALIRAFAEEHEFQVYLQPGGPESVHLLCPNEAELSYKLPEFNLEMIFRATDFIQVNQDINRKMISAAIDLLDLNSNDQVLDLFCGVGNFTLPIATKVKKVTGVEGSESLVNQANSNKNHNGLENITFNCSDLHVQNHSVFESTAFSKLLLDPPRSGAVDLVKNKHIQKADRIVYVSCNPATLARDADELVHNQGYTLTMAGVMDMFPHTSHVESIALFEK